MEFISSLQNPRVKLAVSLRDRRARQEHSLFLIEGYRELSFAQNSRFSLEMLFFCPPLFLGTNEEKLMDGFRARGVPLFETSVRVFEKLSYRDRPDGLIAIATQHHLALSDLKTSSPPFILIAESIEKPGNLGTLLRSADAVGVDAVIVADRTTDIFNPNVVRSSVGSFFALPVVEADNESVYQWLQQQKIRVVAAMPEAKQSFIHIDYKQPIALVVGSEQYGLSDFWEKKSEMAVQIPMGGRCDSLNVASAATLFLYEVFRQRKLGTPAPIY